MHSPTNTQSKSAAVRFFEPDHLIRATALHLSLLERFHLRRVNKQVWRVLSQQYYTRIEPPCNTHMSTWIPVAHPAHRELYQSQVRQVQLYQEPDFLGLLHLKRDFPNVRTVRHGSCTDNCDTITFAEPDEQDQVLRWVHARTVYKLEEVCAPLLPSYIKVHLSEIYKLNTWTPPPSNSSDPDSPGLFSRPLPSPSSRQLKLDEKYYNAANYHPRLARFSFSEQDVDLVRWSDVCDYRLRQGASPITHITMRNQLSCTMDDLGYLLRTTGQALEQLKIQHPGTVAPSQYRLFCSDAFPISVMIRNACPHMASLSLQLAEPPAPTIDRGSAPTSTSATTSPASWSGFGGSVRTLFIELASSQSMKRHYFGIACGAATLMRRDFEDSSLQLEGSSINVVNLCLTVRLLQSQPLVVQQQLMALSSEQTSAINNHTDLVAIVTSIRATAIRCEARDVGRLCAIAIENFINWRAAESARATTLTPEHRARQKLDAFGGSAEGDAEAVRKLIDPMVPAAFQAFESAFKELMGRMTGREVIMEEGLELRVAELLETVRSHSSYLDFCAYAADMANGIDGM